MSSRQLRKLQKQKELEQMQESEGQSAESSGDDEPITTNARPQMSMFAALGGGDDDNEDSENDAQDEEKATQQESEKDSEPESEAAPVPVKKSKKKKKKNKKGKKSETPAPEDESGTEQKNQDDEIEQALKELNMADAARSGGSGELAQTSRDVDELLAINAYHLKAINEMRALFGKEAIEAAEQEEQAEQAAEMRRHGRHGPRTLNLEQALRGHPNSKLPEISLRRNMFIQGRDYWPRANASGLTMKEVRKGEDGVLTEFTFHHDSTYDKTQMVFFNLVQMGEPMNMVALLRECPYHVTTLLQVSKIASQDQNAALAAELCERALFTFGRVSTSGFRQKLEQGKARLDFRRPENREFWLSGYHYLKSLVRKGTYRTALEWAKLLYSINPNDPYAMKNFIHPLAIRARQAQWFIDFCTAPSFLVGETDDVYVKQTMVLAKLQLGDTKGAKELLVEGMERLPWLYCTLFQELSLDPPPSIWGVKPTGNRQYWTNIYIAQAKDLWDNTEATDLLKEAAKQAQKPDVDKLPQDGDSDLRTARFAFLEGNTKLIAGVPRHILGQQPNYEFDPLPPPLSENIFSSEGVRLPWVAASGRSEDVMQTPEARAFFNRMRQQMERAQQRNGAGAAQQDDDGFGEALDAISDDDDEEDVEEIDMEGPARRAAERARRNAEEGNVNGGEQSDDEDEPPQPGFTRRLIGAVFGGGLFGWGGASSGQDQSEGGDGTDGTARAEGPDQNEGNDGQQRPA